MLPVFHFKMPITMLFDKVVKIVFYSAFAALKQKLTTHFLDTRIYFTITMCRKHLFD